jgi:thymidine kinase
MFSGKTTELLREVVRCTFSMGKRTCALIKFSGDTRYSTSAVSTHSSQQENATFSDVKLSHLEVDQYDVIAIDEGQFFPDLVDFCLAQKRRGASVIVAALNGTADQTPFPCIAALTPHLSTSVLLTSICGKCGDDDAMYSVRNDDRASTGDQPDVGGQDKYVAMCYTCLHQKSR